MARTAIQHEEGDKCVSKCRYSRLSSIDRTKDPGNIDTNKMVQSEQSGSRDSLTTNEQDVSADVHTNSDIGLSNVTAVELNDRPPTSKVTAVRVEENGNDIALQKNGVYNEPNKISGVQSTGETITEADDDDDDDDNPQCGWHKWRPKCIQICNNPIGYLSFLSIFVVAQGMTVNGLVYVVVTSLERRYNFPSVRSGFISSSFDFTVMIIIIFVTYVGERGHKPMWLGIGALLFSCGSFMFAVPQFTTGPYRVNDGEIHSDECNAFNQTEDSPDSTDTRGLSNYYWVFIGAQVLHGLGASPIYTLGITYIDENVVPASAGIYLGVFKAFAILGPALGYLLGGVFLGMYIDPLISKDELDITPKSPVWVGAWWMGFLVTGVLALIVAIPLCGFTRSLPGAKKVRELRRNEAHNGHEFEVRAGLSHSLIDFPRATWMLIRNPAFMCVSMVTVTETFTLASIAVFGPKYLESQFNMTSGSAAITAGLLVTPSSVLGALVGGYIVKRFDLKFRGMMKFVLVALCASFLLTFTFMISCPNAPFAGVTVDYGNGTMKYSGKEANLTAGCNADCHCGNDFQPVCGEDNIMYYSACHAGCMNTVEDTEESEEKYHECHCVMSNNVTSNPLAQGGAMSGRCTSDCPLRAPFFALLFLMITFTFLATVPMITATLRVVSRSQRTYALGLQSLMFRLLGSVPGPVVFGALIDQSCLLWEHQSNGSRKCWTYNNSLFSRYTLTLLVVLKLLSILFCILAAVLYKPSKPLVEKVESPEQSEAKVENSRTDLSIASYDNGSRV
ncbi:solute carrier organic anion transporter family member 4A1-like isoform X3 [Lytechinus variegatus]|uniref:solute carrier organic anion transporter family member 4A1-like isoform X3 n=1 Tax=Lytechinus variegatus TaxID=7654 RepID=UPI001BB1C534|nr:solute carrier organic anion transporter family member 4A1-like isoform X3 [Lytechinus variegatus]